jgi:anti-sigma factor RsiW
MGRPFDKHIDEQELNALVPSCIDGRQGAYRRRSDSQPEAERHVASCAECRGRVEQYRRLVDRTNVGASAIHAPEAGCPTDIDWHEVAAGLWPELRTQQLISHAALCAHCGPLLHAATSGDEATPEEKEFLAQLKAPSRPALQPTRVPALASQPLSIWRQLWDWKVLMPAGALLVVVAILIAGRLSSSPLSGRDLAQFAASTHRQYLRRNLALEEQTDSQALLNEWLHGKSQFALALPSSSEMPREPLPYRIEGARLIGIRNKTAAYIAYKMQPDPVSLIITPVSVAVASGGAELSFKKVRFHYYSIEGYKVVTWSVHGLTYALVSQEGNQTQRSCMVCHSTMRDRDLSNTPTPLADQKTIGATYLQ